MRLWVGMIGLLSVLFVLCSGCVTYQNYPKLAKYYGADSLRQDQCAVYGGLIKMPVMASVVNTEIRLLNVESNRIVVLNANAGPFESGTTSFCLLIRPGSYALLNYYVITRTVFGYVERIYPIVKGLSLRKARRQVDAGELKPYDIERYVFRVDSGLNYVGTWDFSSGSPEFSFDKTALDANMRQSGKYPFLDFGKANILSAE